MKCSGSLTICTAPETRRVACEFAALLFAQAFAPLAKSMGFYGESVVDAATRSFAQSERGGLVDHLERTLEAASRDDVIRSTP